MKKILFLLAVTLTGLGVYAQDSNTMYMKPDTAGMYNMKNYLAMKGGVMMVYKNGDSIAMTSVMTLKDSTVVKQDGTITRANGISIKLKNGEGIYMDGRLRMKNDMAKKDSPE
jgi:hypothetical protein